MRIFSDDNPLHAAWREVDWAVTALGDPGGWPPPLRATARLLFDTPVPMALTWGPRRALLYNAAYARLFGEKHPEALGQPLAAVWPERWAEIGPIVERAAAGESFQVEELPIDVERGGTREQAWFTAFFAPLRDDAGAVQGTTCTFVETSRQVRAEQAVRELNRTLELRVAERTAELERSKAHLLSLFGQTAAGIAETDLEMRIVRANAKYADIVGLTPEALVGTRLQDLIHPDDLAHNFAQSAAMIRTGQPFEIENRLVRPDGRTVWVAKMVAPIVEPGAAGPTSTLAVVIDITSRKEAEARARASVERLQLATEAANLGIWSWTVATDRAAWENARMYELLGVPEDQAAVDSGTFEAEFIHPDDVAAYRAAMARTFETGEPFHFEGRFVRASDRAPRWLEFTARLHRDCDGRPVRMIGTAADVTQARETLAQLQSAQGRLEATLGAGEIGTWMFDLAQYKLYADANMARLHGIGEDDVRSASPLAYMKTIHPDDLPAVKASLDRSRATGAPYAAIYRARAADGTERVIHARGKIEFEHGLPARLPGVVIDITQQREIEQKFRQREERYSALLASIDEGFCIIELLYDARGRAVDHRFLETNPAYERHTGLANVVGKTARELAPDIDPAWDDLYARVAASGQPERTQRYAEPLGRWFDVFVSRAERDAVDKVAVVFRDITEQKRADAELRQLAADLAHANRRQNEFLATLAHELRNPLAPIRTGLDLMRLSAGRPGDNAQSLAKVRGMMERQVDHLIHLVNDLLDLARVQRGKVELKRTRVALGEIVTNAVEIALPAVQARHHQLDVQVPDAPLLVDADPNRLVQVIGNLLTNAVKYTPEGGRIVLGVRRDGEAAEIAVRDNGIGIPPEALPGLFEMFNQGRHGMDYAQGGLGIGLSLVKSLVEQHGGTVAAASAGARQGSTFTVRLPLAGPVASVAPAHADGGAAGAGNRQLRILVADDNVDAADLLAASLRLQGHAVVTAHDGLAGLAMARESRPDLALLDIGMPGLDGLALAGMLRADPALPGIVLAAVTGWGSEEDRARSRAAGFDYHLTKPVDLDSVHAIVAAVPTKGNPP